MQLKKHFGVVTLYFDINGNTVTIDEEGILEDIVTSLEGITFIYNDQPFNDLVKEQQKTQKHILVDFKPSVFDELKFMMKSIYSFLDYTNQLSNFIIDRFEVVQDGETIIVYSTELLRRSLSDKTTFSPTVRSFWKTNPLKSETIIKR